MTRTGVFPWWTRPSGTLILTAGALRSPGSRVRLSKPVFLGARESGKQGSKIENGVKYVKIQIFSAGSAVLPCIDTTIPQTQGRRRMARKNRPNGTNASGTHKVPSERFSREEGVPFASITVFPSPASSDVSHYGPKKRCLATMANFYAVRRHGHIPGPRHHGCSSLKKDDNAVHLQGIGKTSGCPIHSSRQRADGPANTH